MTPKNLFQRVDELAVAVVSDPRWQEQNDDLGVSVFGMLLYGYTFAIGRIVMFLDVEDIDAFLAATPAAAGPSRC